MKNDKLGKVLRISKKEPNTLNLISYKLYNNLSQADVQLKVLARRAIFNK